MREIVQDLNRTIMQIKLMTGIQIKIKVNRGRNRVETLIGAVESTYPRIFTFRRSDGELASFSYSDVVSNNVRFYRTVRD